MSAISTAPCTLPFWRQYHFGGKRRVSDQYRPVYFTVLEASAMSAISTTPLYFTVLEASAVSAISTAPCTIPFWRQAPCQQSVPPHVLYRFGGKSSVSDQRRPPYFIVLEGAFRRPPHRATQFPFLFLKGSEDDFMLLSFPRFRHFHDFAISMIPSFPRFRHFHDFAISMILSFPRFRHFHDFDFSRFSTFPGFLDFQDFDFSRFSGFSGFRLFHDFLIFRILTFPGFLPFSGFRLFQVFVIFSI